MDAEQFLDAMADRAEEIDGVAEEMRPGVVSRCVRLLFEPGERDPEIWADCWTGYELAEVLSLEEFLALDADTLGNGFEPGRHLNTAWAAVWAAAWAQAAVPVWRRLLPVWERHARDQNRATEQVKASIVHELGKAGVGKARFEAAKTRRTKPAAG